MKKILAFGLFFLLFGCSTPDDTYRSILNSPHTALAKDPVSQAFGMTHKQKNVEYAVYSALATCDSYGTGCVLEQINGSKVTRSEAQKWRDDYNRNKKYITMGMGVRGSLVIASDTGQRDKEVKKIASKKQAKLKTKQKEKKQEQSAPKKEETIESMLKEVFGDRAMSQIEGLWVTRRDSEEENRIYLIVQSENFLFEEVVISHPVRKFEGQVSTKIIKKINKNSYKTKATWLNDGEVDERDGTIKIIDKFKLKFETSRHCYSSEKDCLKADTFYKKKVWPSKTYSDDANLSKDETKILKDFLD